MIQPCLCLASLLIRSISCLSYFRLPDTRISSSLPTYAPQ